MWPESHFGENDLGFSVGDTHLPFSENTISLNLPVMAFFRKLSPVHVYTYTTLANSSIGLFCMPKIWDTWSHSYIAQWNACGWNKSNSISSELNSENELDQDSLVYVISNGQWAPHVSPAANKHISSACHFQNCISWSDTILHIDFIRFGWCSLWQILTQNGRQFAEIEDQAKWAARYSGHAYD